MTLTNPFRYAWKADAACIGMDPDLFFPAQDAPEAWVTARVICAGCPVRLPCLEYALRNREKFGIWAGTTYRERLRILRRRGDIL